MPVTACCWIYPGVQCFAANVPAGAAVFCQVLAAHADNMSGEAGSAIQGYAAALM